jgi:TRAP-type C4-dicarboxylate transport system permease small subunit
MHWLSSRARELKKVAEIIGALLFLAMFSGFLLQVFSRYVMNEPLSWSVEFIRVMAIWTVFWSAAFLVPIRDHVAIEVLIALCPPEVQRVLAIATLAIGAGVFLYSLPAILDLINFLARRRSPVLGWPMKWVFACYVLFVVGYVAQSLWQLRALLSARWRSYLEDGTRE